MESWRRQFRRRQEGMTGLRTRLTALLDIEHPIIQGGMSWAANAELAAAVSSAGALGVIGAGPMYPDALRDAIRFVKARTAKPFAVNVPLYRSQADLILDIVIEEQAPILIASQGGPQKYLARFHDAGRKCLHIVASAQHAEKAAAAGVDGLVAVGAEAGGHPPPNEVGTLVLARRVVTAVPDIPVVASGGIVDGAGIAAVLALGCDGAQLGTRFLMTKEAGVHDAYKEACLAAEVDHTVTIGRGFGLIRMLKNAFAERYLAAEAAARPKDEMEALFKSSSLKMAAFDGNVAEGKIEAGQGVGLIRDVPAAGDLVRRLVAETSDALARVARLT
jgi:enoyl-[acyl-carrier protein] reductase II